MRHLFRHARGAFHALAFVAVLIGGFSLGLMPARQSQVRADDRAPSRNHEVAQKLWVSAQEIQDRFPTSQHAEFMRRAIANSRAAGVVERTGGAVGALIVDRGGQIVADCANHVVDRCDPTAHAEMEAIRAACAKLKVLKLDGCILYASAELCPMCLATCYWAGLDGVCFAALTADSKKFGGFDDAFIFEQLHKPPGERKIPEIQMLREEAVSVWKEFATLPDNVPY
jgi:guanine deaminase